MKNLIKILIILINRLAAAESGVPGAQAARGQFEILNWLEPYHNRLMILSKT